ncbi:hypothetical protein A5780_11570 [Nocardia sp. 852002-20019_SCH5090214]|uniref:hypothetical protein n=1 Tax=Nocardia sp. 852002-20019_SCH5090214 TaxID=1834087 RepID=UPI0007EB8E43|nr:hypothetical protein [Nocardia sp. 852002-20019_SCH5090214]OBA67077.1 hypothetical protein A5780_11570 [Nocardia sp. 852002-20019_SCH5090214]
MDDLIDDQYDVFRSILDKYAPVEAVTKLSLLGPEDVIKRILKRYEADTVRIHELQEPRAVVIDNYETRFAGLHPDDKLWPALTEILRGQGWSQNLAIGSLGTSSTRIVSLLSRPRERSFSTRGLVVGYMQSCKTINFTAVIAKAADRGYKLFIVLAGIHSGLRRKIQARLIQQLIEPNPSMGSQITDLDVDFRSTANPASFFGKSNKTHVLCFVKKNAPVLRKIFARLGDAQDYLADCHALIIDDEVDQATVTASRDNLHKLDRRRPLAGGL